MRPPVCDNCRARAEPEPLMAAITLPAAERPLELDFCSLDCLAEWVCGQAGLSRPIRWPH